MTDTDAATNSGMPRKTGLDELVAVVTESVSAASARETSSGRG
jgi:hypothetical protein